MQHSEEEILALHRKYAASDAVFELIYTHCQIVRDIALDLIEISRLPLDIELVTTGAMVHDIGVYELFNANGTLKPNMHYIQHGVKGEGILQNEGFPEILCRFASHHTGVGLTKEDVITQGLPLPVTDYMAATDEELLVMYADKFHSKSTPPMFNSYESYRIHVSRFGVDHVERFDAMAAKFGKPDLAKYQTRYGFEIQ